MSLSLFNYFHKSTKKSQWKQITESFERALNTHPNLAKFYICLPQDRADPRIPDKNFFMDKWNEYVENWKSIAKSHRVPFVMFTLYDQCYVVHRTDKFVEKEYDPKFFLRKL